MNKLLVGLISLSSVILSGCNDNNESQKDPSVGIWFYQDGDAFFEIDSESRFFAFECIYDQYEKQNEITGNIDGDVLEIINSEVNTSSTYKVEYVDNEMILSSEDFSFSLEPVSELPVFCEKDWIHITFSHPAQANENTETEFIINYDYRLTSESAVIELCFTSDNNSSCTVPQGAQDFVSEKGLGSGSLSVIYSPQSVESPYYLHVHLSPENQEGSYSPYAEDSVLITIIK